MKPNKANFDENRVREQFHEAYVIETDESREALDELVSITRGMDEALFVSEDVEGYKRLADRYDQIMKTVMKPLSRYRRR